MPAADTYFPQLGGFRFGFFTLPPGGTGVPPGEQFDFDAALRPLREAGYAGWMIVEAEQDPARAHPLTYARSGHAALLATVRRLGFTID